MRRAFAIGAGILVLVGIACSTADDDTIAAPPVTAVSPELRIERFDVVEPGWGEAPVGVHFLWAIESTTGRPLTCDLDLDGDGTFDQRIEGCRPSTLDDPIESLPARTYTTPGAHVPKLVVSDGVHTVEATQEIYANKVTFAKNTVLPERLPGFVSAEAVPNTSVVLTFASEAEVPNVNVGDILWGTSGFGYLIKATEVTKAGRTLTVNGVQGKVNEAIENGFIGARDVSPSYDDVRCLDADCQGATIEKLDAQPARPPTLTPQALGVDRAPLRLETSGNLGVKISLPNGGEPFDHSIFVGFRIKKFILDVSFFTVNELTFDVVPGFNYELAFKGEIFEKKILLGTFTLGTIPIGPVAIVPIVFPTLTFGANLKFGGSIGFDIPVHAKYTPATGVELDFTADRLGRAQEVLDPIGSGASFEAEAKLSFPVKALAWGVAGPYVGPVMGLTGELKIGTPQATSNPCNSLMEICAGAKASFGGEYGLGCPWIEAIEVKRELTALELELYKKCYGRDSSDPEKCADAGSDGGPNDGDAGADAAPPACVPTGTVTGPPTGSPSGAAHCGGSEVFWSGANLGTGTCWTIGDRTFPSLPGSGERAVIPDDIPPGTYTLTVQAAGGSVTAPFTITAGQAPNAANIAPASGPPGAVVTITGTGLTDLDEVTLSPAGGGGGSATSPVTSGTGTSLTFHVPDLPPGDYEVHLVKANCGSDTIAFTVTAPPSTLSACWQASAGSYSPMNTGCGLAAFAVTVDPSSVTASPFGTNGSVVFSDPGGVALSATGLAIFGQPNHTCTLTCNGAQITAACTNPGGGSCAQPLNKQ